MCPDKSLLSAWYDGEIEEPWKSEIAAHIKECPSCAKVLEEFSQTSLFLKSDHVVVSRYKKKEIYRQVIHQHRRGNIIPFWQKQIPWPAAAAAVFILGISLIFPAFQNTAPAGSPQLVLLEEKEEAPDLSAIARLTPIMLPPEHDFAYYGDSQLLKAVGFEGDSP